MSCFSVCALKYSLSYWEDFMLPFARKISLSSLHNDASDCISAYVLCCLLLIVRVGVEEVACIVHSTVGKSIATNFGNNVG